jgi:hypothetical protein
MWLSLFLLAIIAAIAYFQAIQGFFSALIMCVLTMLCCAFAFATHEYVAVALLAKWKPDFALPLALAGCFAVPLIILRVVADAIIRRNCLISNLADKIGGAFFGLVAGLLIGGTLAVALQMLPFGEPFLGHRRLAFTSKDTEAPTEEGLVLSPDGFAVRCASMCSSGIFSGKRPWTLDHPDYLKEIGWSQTATRGVRCFAPSGTLHSVVTESVPVVYEKHKEPGRPQPDFKPYTEIHPSAGHRFIAVRFHPSSDAADEDRQQRFSLYQIRIVGEDSDGATRQFHPIAIRDASESQEPAPADDTVRYIKAKSEAAGKIQPVVMGLYSPNEDGEVAVVFELPEKFKARFLEYKMGTRFDLTRTKTQAAAEPKKPPMPPPPPATEAQRPPLKAPGGRTHGANVADAQFSNDLPYRLTHYQDAGGDVETQENQLLNGHLLANLDEQGTNGGLTALRRPEGKAILQINAEVLRGGSTLGSAKSFAVKNIRNYIVTDDMGSPYKICGQIAVAKVGSEKIIEVQYYPEFVGSIGGVKNFRRIKDRHLTGSNYEMYFLFVIDSGRKVMTFSTTGSSGGQDLSGLDLVAP